MYYTGSQRSAKGAQHHPPLLGSCLSWPRSPISATAELLLETLISPAVRLRSIVMSMSVCLSERISPELHALSLPNFCACCLCPWFGPFRHVDDRPHRLSAGRGDGSAPRGRSVIYYCLVVCYLCVVRSKYLSSYLSRLALHICSIRFACLLL